MLYYYYVRLLFIIICVRNLGRLSPAVLANFILSPLYVRYSLHARPRELTGLGRPSAGYDRWNI